MKSNEFILFENVNRALNQFCFLFDRNDIKTNISSLKEVKNVVYQKASKRKREAIDKSKKSPENEPTKSTNTNTQGKRINY